MKGVLSILAAAVLTANMFGQATQGMSHQAEISDRLSEPLALATAHYVGEFYGGGIVFHVYDGGQHGLITAVVEDSKRKQRQSGAYADTIDFRGGIGAGKIITERVITFKEARTGDTQVSANNQVGNFSDWYLPTRYDLNLLYLNRAVIGGYADFAKGWKLTGVSSLNVWYQSFITGARFTNGKDDAVYVRVLRKF